MCAGPSALTQSSEFCRAEISLRHWKGIRNVRPSGVRKSFHTGCDVAQEQLLCYEAYTCSGRREDDTVHTCLPRNTTGTDVSTLMHSTEFLAIVTFTLRCLQ